MIGAVHEAVEDGIGEDRIVQAPMRTDGMSTIATSQLAPPVESDPLPDDAITDLKV